ncbi:MAG: single-stranded DNA-binding protein [Patescibacteria group bacterium]
MSRSLNKVILIGNLTRDPELRYTPAGTAVCTFGLATNRAWKTESGEMKEDAEFHRLVAWNKLAEICAQMLTKGKRTYVEGRIQSRKWTAQDGTEKTTFEVVISDMILLDSRREVDELNVPEDLEEAVPASGPDSDSAKKVEGKKKEPKKEKESEEDIPF